MGERPWGVIINSSLFVSSKMAKQTKRYSSKRVKKASNRNRNLFIVLLVAGVVLAVAAGALFFQHSTQSAAPADISQIPDDLAVATLAGVRNQGTAPVENKPAPNFAFRYPDGSSFTLADFQGKPVIVNFWATWCPPCRREMPGLVNAYETYKDDGLVILEVDVAEPAQAVAQFVQEYNMTMPVILDQRQEVARLYRTDSFPTTFFIDSEGVIQLRWTGYLPEDQLALNLKKIMP
ncbi:MAG TPA: redoxin domain-containing protein [Anaerolineae bacterium]|nr:redoxin domain-containing protein [Anaerolineae bacterium]HIQ11366.1 redoxin domain-containing protein [Caldilineales bacterium]